MNTLNRRLLRLEAANGRRLFRHLGDADLDAMLVAELRAWLGTQPADCPGDLRAEVLAFVAAHDEEGTAR
ncbi:MAG: hypothetical protein ICV73_20220 [Acetobacteraceae bacterium]|nr:hypothetical protein [Acetobacteraceae bacterium]